MLTLESLKTINLQDDSDQSFNHITSINQII